MNFTKEQLSIPVNFLISIERTGSSMLTAMLNSHPEILSPPEEPFLIYLYPAYKNKIHWKEHEIDKFINEYKLLSERIPELYFSPFSELKKSMLLCKDDLDFQSLCRLIYLHFIPLKDKNPIKQIIDKQIKYILFLDKIAEIIPDSKFLILVRDYRDVICSWKKRGLGSSNQAAYLAELWNISYSSALNSIKKHPERFMICRYEDLIANPETALKKIVSFLGATYHENMLQYHKMFGNYMEKIKDTVPEKFIKDLKSFHSNTLKSVSTELSGKWKIILSNEEIIVSETIAGKTGKHFGYEISTEKKSTLNFVEYFAIFRAYWEKKIYLPLYIYSPFWMKLWIKKIHPNKLH